MLLGGGVGLTFKNRGHFWVLGIYIYIYIPKDIYIYFPKDPLVCLQIPGLTRTNPIVGIGLGPSNLGRGMDP